MNGVKGEIIAIYYQKLLIYKLQ